MKIPLLSLLIAAFMLIPSSLLAADIPSCGQTCPPGPCECVAPPMINDMPNGSGFTVEGGKPDFEWSVCGVYTVSEDTRSVSVTDSSKCCGAGAVAVTDACNRVATKPVEFNRELSITGPEVASVGSDYNASGGSPPYTWSFSKGTINSDGTITDMNACSSPGEIRTGVITVKDVCKTSVSKEVLLQGGSWVQIFHDVGECNRDEVDGTITSVCRDHWAYDTVQKVHYCYSPGDYATGISISGKTKIETVWGIVAPDGNYWGKYHWFVDSIGQHAPASCLTGPNSNQRVFAWTNTIYEWRCP